MKLTIRNELSISHEIGTELLADYRIVKSGDEVTMDVESSKFGDEILITVSENDYTGLTTTTVWSEKGLLEINEPIPPDTTKIVEQFHQKQMAKK